MADPRDLSRRDLLKAAGGAGVVGAGTLAGLQLFGGEDASTERVDDDRARELAVQYAPTLYFDAAERWFPTDPQPYESETDGETVVDGFDALDGYTEEFTDDPPDPTVFYRAVRYEDSPLAVVQFWLYSAFDQFATNFHWHDWEAVHVFVDVEAEAPQLFVASAHSRKVPNNEFLDPEPGAFPRILPELGSHSSGLSVNENRDSFQRFSLDGAVADVTNQVLDDVEAVDELPIAYGLPRDEGSRLPFVVPELDGEAIYDHERLPAVDRSDLIPADLTVRSFEDLASPPSDLSGRETGLVFGHDHEDDADVRYALKPAADLEHIGEFTGPQLSFEFAIPEYAEDRIAGHITSTGVPWDQPRYDNPAADISDPSHRSTLAERYDAIAGPDGAGLVVAAVQETIENADAPDGEGVTTADLGVEAVVLVESDPEAVPTFGGVAVAADVPAGDHQVTVNGAGVAPHSERVTVDESDGATAAGVDGRIAVAARENAVKLRVDADGTDADLRALAVEDDFAGRLYDAPLAGRDSVYVHGGGAYTTEVRDADDEVGAFRVNPGEEGEVTVERPRTGKASLATFLAEVSEETATRVRAELDDDDSDSGDVGDGSDDDDGDNVRGLTQALDAVADAAARAAERAEADDENGADQRLETVRDRLTRATERLTEASDDLPDPVAAAADRRIDQARRRNEQALDAGKL